MNSKAELREVAQMLVDQYGWDAVEDRGLIKAWLGDRGLLSRSTTWTCAPTGRRSTRLSHMPGGCCRDRHRDTPRLPASGTGT